MDWLGEISQFWPRLAAGCDFLAALLASVHALLNKRDPRATTLWLGIIWFLPVFGPVLYLALGVNRIRRRAVQLRVHGTFARPIPEDYGEPEHMGAEHLKMLARAVSGFVTIPLTAGNKIRPLVNGDEAFPAMLAAIECAQKSVTLSTYIFDNDASGKQFVEALSRAVDRGAEVRVLVDAAGRRYSWPPITARLRHHKIPFAKFLPASLLTPWRVATINLRNHRKALVVDGQIAFTGGMNIRHGNILGVAAGRATPGAPPTAEEGRVRSAAPYPRNAVQDLQFQVEGPAVAQLQEAFANDWAFTTREILDGERWFPELAERGNVIARVITDGPDIDFEKARWTLLAALAEAQTSVQILTPYFLPDGALIAALNLAALRGVRVDIILPSKNNLPFALWASRSLWWQVLERGCHVWLTPPPFDHSKLMIVDGHWVLLGSANWDTRSLRLNFELNVECYGRDFAREMQNVIAKKVLHAREVMLPEVDQRALPVKLLDATARLFSPFL